MSIGTPIHEIQHFQSLTLKIQGQGHSSRSQSRYNTIDSYPFRSMSIGPPIPGIQLFQNLTLKIQGQGLRSNLKVTTWVQHSFDSHPFVSCQLGIPFLSYDFFKIWPLKWRVKVMGEVTAQSHNVGLTSYRLTSLAFHVNLASHSWVTTFSKFDLENQGPRSLVKSQFKVTVWD